MTETEPRPKGAGSLLTSAATITWAALSTAACAL
jgi:hypothetical protein